MEFLIMRSTVLILLLAIFCGSSSALRCYTCEDCDEQSQLNELDVCSAPTTVQQPSVPIANPNPAPAPAPAPSPAAAGAPVPAPAPAAAPAAASDGTDEDYESEEDESVPQPTRPIRPGAAGPVAAPAPAAAAAALPGAAASGNMESESEDEDEDEDYDDGRRRRRISRQSMDNHPRAVCYIASLRLNDTVITNRGCTFVVDDNSTAACTNLYTGWDVVGCQLCESNGCNSPIHGTVVGQWNSGSSCRLSGQTALGMTLLSLIILLARVS